MRYYEYRHRVSFEETNVVGNVYFTNYLLWQGRCREMFLYEHASELMPEMGRGLALATTRVACSFYRELAAFEEVAVRMRASAMTPSRLTMAFQYFHITPEGPEEFGSRRRTGGSLHAPCRRTHGAGTTARGPCARRSSFTCALQWQP
jgi:enediyne biosynthesis thioesterase